MKRRIDFRAATILFAILIGSAALYIAGFTYTVGHGIDDGIHVVAAKALATGRGLHMISDPRNPPATQFPPGLSVALVPVLALFPDPPDNIIPLKLVSTLFALAFAGVSWRWFRRHLQTPTALCLTALVAINPETVRFAGAVIAEMGYAAFSMLALLLYERYDEREDARRGYALLGGAIGTMTAAYLFRSVGLSLVLASLGLFAVRRRWGTVAVVAVAFLALASPWLMQSALVGTPEYRDQFWLVSLEDPERGRIGMAGLFDRAWANGIVYPSRTVPDHLFPLLGAQRVVAWFGDTGLSPLLTAARLGISLLVLAGLWRRLRKRAGIVELYIMLYFGTLLIWHNRLHWKYMAPITPILLLYLYIGLRGGVEKLSRFRAPVRVLVPGFLALLLVSCAFRAADAVERGWIVRGEIDPYRPAYRWLKTHTPPESLLMGVDHLGLYLYTGRKSIAPGMTHSPKAALEYIRSTHTDYFIVAPGQVTRGGIRLDLAYLRPVVERYPEYFTRVYEDPGMGIEIYRVEHAAARRRE